MVQFGAFWGKTIFFCQNNVDSAAYSRIGSYAPVTTTHTSHNCCTFVCNMLHMLVKLCLL